MLNEKRLHLSGVASLERSEILPLVQFDGIDIRDRNAEVAEDAAKEFVVGEDDGIHEDVVTQLDDEELVLSRAGVEHVAVLVLDKYR